MRCCSSHFPELRFCMHVCLACRSVCGRGCRCLDCMGVLSSVTIMLLSRQHPVVCLSAVAIRFSARASKYVCMYVCTAACFKSRLGLHGAVCVCPLATSTLFPRSFKAAEPANAAVTVCCVAATAHSRGSLSNGCRVGVVLVVACVPARAWEESVSRSWTAIPPAFGPNRAVLCCTA